MPGGLPRAAGSLRDVPDPSSTATLRDVVTLLHRRYDPRTADSWDRVGLVCGDPDEPVEQVMFAVDPVAAVVDEAIADGVQLLVTHHPLFLSGVHGIPADDFKGRVVHRLVRAGIGLLAAHTNADNARPGVSDAIATALGLAEVAPLEPLDAEPDPIDKYIVFVPVADTEALIDAMAAAGAGQIGDYDRAAFSAPGTGTFRPLAGANPTIGSIGRIESVAGVDAADDRPASPARRGHRRPACGPPLRGAGVRRDRAGRRPERARRGPGRGPRRADHARGVRRPRRRHAADASRRACGRPAIRAG